MKKDHTDNLSQMQREVLVNKATERPFSGAFLDHDDEGDYSCAACGSVLFNSDTKFKAPYPNEGWPSFYDVANNGAVQLNEDLSHGMKRIEAVCNNCGGHLGHMFYDGNPAKNDGAHYCINSAALNFKSQDGKTRRGDGQKTE